MGETTRPIITVILGAGASRDVSYAAVLNPTASDPGPAMPSPLDSDFFDLLQQLEARMQPGKSKGSVSRIIEKVMGHKGEPLWQSMEKMFYSLHVRAVLDYTLIHRSQGPDLGHKLIEDFLASIRVLLREAHGMRACNKHFRLFQELRQRDAVLTFNYDFVAERALASRFYARNSQDTTTRFGSWFYGLADRPKDAPKDVPVLYKLHGSLNWSLGEDENGETINLRGEWPQTWLQFAEQLQYEPSREEGYRRDNNWRPPVLLPYWEKRVEKGLWLELWRAAAQQLRRTDLLVIWGYSLPTTDLKARELLTLAFEGRGAKLAKVAVIDPSKDTQDRWRQLFLGRVFFRFPNFEEFNRSWMALARGHWPENFEV